MEIRDVPRHFVYREHEMKKIRNDLLWNSRKNELDAEWREWMEKEKSRRNKKNKVKVQKEMEKGKKENGKNHIAK